MFDGLLLLYPLLDSVFTEDSELLLVFAFGAVNLLLVLFVCSELRELVLLSDAGLFVVELSVALLSVLVLVLKLPELLLSLELLS